MWESERKAMMLYRSGSATASPDEAEDTAATSLMKGGGGLAQSRDHSTFTSSCAPSSSFPAAESAMYATSP